MLKVKRQLRHKGIRRTVKGTTGRPRLAVFRSSAHIYAQLVDDSQGKTIAGASDLKIKEGEKREKAMKVGEELAKLAQSKKIKQVVFDRGGFRYHGRIAAVAEGARKGGLEF